MTREETIKQAALAYSFDTDGGHSGDLNAGRDDFIEGAKWADKHPAIFWHKVADGDLPKGVKSNNECMPFIVKTKNGNQYLAYYAKWLDEEYRMIRHDFFDNCGCLLDVEYWMEIPKLPENNK